MLKDLVNKAKDKLDDVGIDDLADLKKLAEKPEVKKALNALISFLEKNDKDTVVKVLKSIAK
ncbi:MAG: hypothetical protein E7600_03965 [Ruminococcaceae bacterium]|nr:hypothetical protein [Oscillospiraceae bacterium]